MEDLRAAVMFVVIREDAVSFRPNHEACPSFARYLREASEAGVQGRREGTQCCLYTTTRKGCYLEKRFCKLFLESSTVVLQFPCCLGKQMELSEKR